LVSENGAEGREHEPTGSGESDGSSDAAGRRPDEVRVGAVEAAVAAGLVVPPKTQPELSGEQTRPAPPAPDESEFVLPDWSEPPTGQVPKVLLDPYGDPDATRVPGPTWRQTDADWEADEDTLGFIVQEVIEQDEEEDDSSTIAGRGEDPTGETKPFEFDFTPATRRRRVRRSDGEPVSKRTPRRGGGPSFEDEVAWAEVVAERRRRRRRAPVHRAERPAGEAPRRNTAVALSTGVVLAGIAVACFESGSLAVLVLGSIVLSLAAGESFGAIRSSGRRPVALVGLAGVPALAVASYLRGAEAVPVVLAGTLLAAGVWRILVESQDSSLDDIASTLLVTAWFGVAGAFVGILLNPSAFPHRHGVAYVGAAVFLTVAHDVGSYLVGARIGRHRLVPRVSPGKTLEGLLGGTIFTLVVAGVVVSYVHPFSLATALALGAIVVVFAPLGDLVESLVKRDLGRKDMGRLLPAHGGVADRIDALMFVLPATYVLVRLVHIG
jgi:phosphatidate cytidylyltransferase